MSNILACDKVKLFNMGITGGFGGVFASLIIYSAIHFNGVEIS